LFLLSPAPATGVAVVFALLIDLNYLAVGGFFLCATETDEALNYLQLESEAMVADKLKIFLRKQKNSSSLINNLICHIPLKNMAHMLLK